jgi:hypothetical protein
MSIAQAGLAFRVTEPIDDLAAVVSSVFDEAAAEVTSPVAERFDIRNRADVMVQWFGNVCFFCNDPLVSPLLQGTTGDADATRLLRALGKPPLAFAFRHDDAASSYGYAVFERGERRRTRLQCGARPGAPDVAESGPPLPFERRWLAASHFVEGDAANEGAAKVYYLGDREVLVPEKRLTGRMLQEGLETHFGVCPWETLITPTYRFFRLGPAEPGTPPAAAAEPAARRKPWWRRA